MISGHRMPPDVHRQVDYTKKLWIYFNGKPVPAFAGETVAIALFASGRRIFSRSFKYHRPRGLLCCSGACPNCLMNIDGIPNSRACRVPVREGLHVSPQHAWPSLDHDWLNVIEMFDRLMPVGFYYKTLYKPKWLWKIAEPVIRQLAGLGKIDTDNRDQGQYEHTYESTDVAVIGGGPAGMAAALRAAGEGVSVTLIESDSRLGGHLRCRSGIYDLEDFPQLPGYDIALQMESAALNQRNIRVWCDATGAGAYEGGLLPILRGKTLIHLRTKSMIVATGCHECPPLFRNNDLPGVMLGRAALRMINQFGIRPGRRAVILTTNDHGYAVAEECLRAGIKIAEVVDARSTAPQCKEARILQAQSVPIAPGSFIREAIGKKAVKGVRLGPLDHQARHQAGTERVVECDLVLASTGWQPATALLYQAGCNLKFDARLGQEVPETFAPGVFAAGEIWGLRELQDILLSGRVAAVNAIAFLNGHPQPGNGEVDRLLSKARTIAPAFSPPAPTKPKRTFICFCEDVVEKDLRDGVIEGFDEIETLKRYSTISMGPCQGKMCGRNASEICSLASGLDVRSVGLTTSRPPIIPVPLGALAGLELHPVKLTSLHYRHAALTNVMMDMGVWKRPLVYTSVAEEYEAVRKRVGLIDISTLGKIIVQGHEAPKLLDKVYTPYLSTLKPGCIRYGMLCDESGIILDDGTVARLAADHFYITTTTGNVDFVEQWLKWWTAGTGWCVHILNVTAAYAAVNLAGPRAREVLSTLTEIDVSANGFPYMGSRTGSVAGVPSLLLRIGFVGETGWEIHFPAEFGEYLWDRIMDAGRAFGIQPFGVETQRLLRLEKKHVIVGQDTDSLSNPFDADIAWAVKLDKADFIGRHSLARLRSQPSRDRLVGFRMKREVAPADGSAITIDGKLVGRVTSVRFSPHVGQFIGLAWLPAKYAQEGKEFQVYVEGKTYPAEVVQQAFYDPEGARVK